MNYTRILLGGLLAGVVINVGEFLLWAVILADRMETMMATMGLTEPSWAMLGYVATGFLVGIVLAWLYAAIRPRFGAGWKTGIVAAVPVFILAWIAPAVWFAAVGISMGMGTTLLALVWEYVFVAAAGVAGGWVYQEQEGRAAAAAHTGYSS